MYLCRINLDDILEDELEFNANGTLTSSLTGSLGKTWSTSVLNLNSSVANATSVGPNEGGDVIIQFLVERGCSLPVFSQATDGTVVAKVNRPPPSPYDQSPTKCLYKGNIVGNRLLGNVYKATNRPDSPQESSYDYETNVYEQIGIFQLSRSL